MARRKNVKRIDPRYFLDETVTRDDLAQETEEILQEEPPPGLATTADVAPVAAREESGSRVTRVLDWLIGQFDRATQDLTDAEVAAVRQELARQTAPGGEFDIGPAGALDEDTKE